MAQIEKRANGGVTFNIANRESPTSHGDGVKPIKMSSLTW